MNIFRREMRAGRKVFFFWMIGLVVLCFEVVTELGSYSSGGAMEELLGAFPRVVLAVMGIAGVDIAASSGYVTALFYYVLICQVVYAVLLGAGAVSRELVDRTHEFLFTKPRARWRILAAKCAAKVVYLALFSLSSAAFAYAAVLTEHRGDSAAAVIPACALAVFLTGLLFFALAAFLAALARRPEKGALCGNLAFLVAFVLGTVYGMLESPGPLRLFSPLDYFTSSDLAAARVDPGYAILALSLTVLFLSGAFRRFARRDLV
jgi:ABC-2 type transport system permease protein